MGDPTAIEYAEDGLRLAQAKGALGLQPFLDSTLGEIALAKGDLDSAEKYFADGLALAEADMALRGTGDATGVRQSGEAGFRVLDIVRDAEVIRRGQAMACEDAVDERMAAFWRPMAESVD